MSSTSRTASDFLIERLSRWGVRRIFGYPGEGINGIIGSLDKAQDTLEFVLVAHEEHASFAACAHAKFTGQVGVCTSTAGPGAVHLLNGLYDAKLDRQPVVAVVGQQPTYCLGGNFQQELDLHLLFRDVAEFVVTVTNPTQLLHVVDRAFRVSLSQRAVSVLIIPCDVQLEVIKKPPEEHGAILATSECRLPLALPTADQGQLQRAADILNDGKRVAILIGIGAKQAAEEVQILAEVLGAGVAKAFLGKSVLPDDLPYVTGSIGQLGTPASANMMKHCDTLLLIGTSFPYCEALPEPGQARGIQIDLDASSIGMRYTTEVNIIGDAKDTLRRLLPLLKRKSDRQWREDIEEYVRQSWQELERRAMETAEPLNPQRVFWELSPFLPDNCIITTDSGTSSVWAARDIKLRKGMQMSVSGGLASMGCALPYAMAAKLAFPDRAVIATSGDGAMQMSGINAMITISRMWRSWSNPSFIVLVLNNGDLSQVTWEQRLMSSMRRYGASQALPAMPYAEFAKLLGFHGIVLDSPARVVPVWKEAFAAKRPVLIEAIVDQNVPVLPPKLSEKHLHSIEKAIQGDESKQEILHQVEKENPQFAAGITHA